jgi:plastocyanin
MLFALAVVATACAGQGITAKPAEIDESTFVIHVADFENDVGRGLSISTDAQGNPHLAYLALEDLATTGATPAPGPTPTPAVAGAPQLPAVKHAHLVGGAWTRSVVAEDTSVEVGDQTAIAVDANGVHHVVWTEEGALRYSNNAGGAFSEPETIAEAGVSGPSITVTGDGIPLVAFYQEGGSSPDVPTPVVRGALGTEGGWAPETVAEARPETPATTAIGVSGVQAVIAYGSGGTTFVARRTDTQWESEEADADGGLGVSMSIDADGNPHLAYCGGSGQVRHAHSIDGGPWETSVVGSTCEIDTAGPSIVVDQEGVHHVAWEDATGISYANNQDGDFVAEQIPGSMTRPPGKWARLALGQGGVVYLAWYDPEDTEVHLAVRGGGEPLLAVPQPGPGAQPTTEPTAPPTGPPPCEPSGTELSITASGIAFDTPCLAAPAGQPFTIQFDNQDAGTPHNVGIYSAEGGEELFKGDLITGPATATYDVPALDPGQFYFQCDVHPNMNGTFVVA